MTALSFIRLILNTVAFLMLLFCKKNIFIWKVNHLEAAVQRCFLENVFWK